MSKTTLNSEVQRGFNPQNQIPGNVTRNKLNIK